MNWARRLQQLSGNRQEKYSTSQQDFLKGPGGRDAPEFDDKVFDLEPVTLGLDLGIGAFTLVDLAKLHYQQVEQVGPKMWRPSTTKSIDSFYAKSAAPHFVFGQFDKI